MFVDTFIQKKTKGSLHVYNCNGARFILGRRKRAKALCLLITGCPPRLHSAPIAFPSHLPFCFSYLEWKIFKSREKEVDVHCPRPLDEYEMFSKTIIPVPICFHHRGYFHSLNVCNGKVVVEIEGKAPKSDLLLGWIINYIFKGTIGVVGKYGLLMNCPVYKIPTVSLLSLLWLNHCCNISTQFIFVVKGRTQCGNALNINLHKLPMQII